MNCSTLQFRLNEEGKHELSFSPGYYAVKELSVSGNLVLNTHSFTVQV